MPTITVNLGGYPSDAILNLNPQTSYSGSYSTVIKNGLSYPYSIYNIIVHPVDGEYWENPVVRTTDVNGSPQWNIDVVDNVDIVIDVYFRTNPTVTWNLIGCSYDINVSSARWYSGIGYNTNNSSGWVLADTGYDLHNSIVSILINNVDKTSELWTNPPMESVEQRLAIGIVDGNVLVNITATSASPRTITYNLQHCSSSNTDTTIPLWGNYSSTITADSDYTLEGATVEILYGGVNNPNYYNNGEITIGSVSKDIVINITAVERPIFKFYSADGNTLHFSLRTDKLSTMFSRIQGTTRFLTLNEVAYSYIGSSIPMGKIFAGYSNRPNSSIPTYAVDFDLIVNFSQSTNFYEVIVDEQELGDMMLNLYKNTSENERLDKTNYLTMVNTLYGSFKDVTSITNPSIIIEYGIIDFNYVYIPILNRYYYVEEVISVKNRLWQIRLKVDVLMSYKSIIRQQSGLIGRSASQYSEDLIDSERIVKNNPIVVVREVSTSIFSPDGTGRIVANVVGGD